MRHCLAHSARSLKGGRLGEGGEDRSRKPQGADPEQFLPERHLSLTTMSGACS